MSLARSQAVSCIPFAGLRRADAARRAPARAAPEGLAAAAARSCRARTRPSNRRRRGRRGCPCRSSIASLLAAIGRMSPWAATRCMWSSGAACSQTVRAVREQQVEGGRVRDHPARRRDHRLGVDLDRLLERAPLVASVGVLAVEGLDLADAAAGELLDLAAQLDEGESQVLGQHRLPASTCRRRAGRPARPASCAAPVRCRARRRCRAGRRSPRARGAASPRRGARAVRGSAATRATRWSRRPAARPASIAAPAPPAAAPGSTRCRRRTPGSPGGAPRRRRPVPDALRVMPRRARRARTRSPSATRKGFLPSPSVALAGPGGAAVASVARSGELRCLPPVNALYCLTWSLGSP